MIMIVIMIMMIMMITIMIIIIIIMIMVKFSFPTSSLKCAMSFAALPGGMLGARGKQRPLPLSLVGRCASCNDNHNNNN